MFLRFYEDDYHHLMLVMCDYTDYFTDYFTFWTQNFTGTVLHKDVLKYHLFSVFSLLFLIWSPATPKKTPPLNATLRLQLAASLCLHVEVFYELMLPRAAIRLQTILIFPLYSSWLRERSGTF